MLRAAEPERAAAWQLWWIVDIPPTPLLLGGWATPTRSWRGCGRGGQQRVPDHELKVGLNVDDDVRRCRIAREAIGEDVALAIDANQRWDVITAIPWLRRLAPFNIAWIEEPTSPDDILGHAAIRKAVAPLPVSTGEHIHNRVMFKQLFQAKAVDLIQIDAARVGGVNENLAILLMAAKFGVRVFHMRGGVGLV